MENNLQNKIYINDEYYYIFRELGYNYYIIKNEKGEFFLADIIDLACPNGGYSTISGVLIPLLEDLTRENFEKAVEDAINIRKRIKIIYN